MRFSFSDEQRAFAAAVRDVLEKECAPAHVRAAWDSETGRAPERWRALADLGVIGITVPQQYGGLGMDDVDLVLLSEEAGRACLPEPLLEHTAVAIPLLRDHARDALRERWLSAAADGTAVLSVGLGDEPLVADGDLLLMRHGDEIHAVERASARLSPQPSWDRARRLFTVDWQPGADTLVTADPIAARDAESRAALHAAAQLVGIGARVIEMAAAYALDRRQFGAPIGSFQAVKHLLADALVGVEFARPSVYRAAWSMAHGLEARARDASMAKAMASDAARAALRAALQVHGAIGYTKECDLHLWLARGFALAGAWGDAARHRDLIKAVLFSE